MTVLAKVNKRRLWVLLTAIWVVAVASYYWDEIAVRYGASFGTKAEIDIQAQESRFFDCLSRTNATWFSLETQFGEECKAYARDQCKASMIWCANDRIEDLCLKNKSAECRNIYFTSEPAEDFDTAAWRRKKMREHISFYLSTDFSAPLKSALLLIFSVPLLLAFLPRVSRILWRWLANG